jgi:hypothetical protein
VTAWLSLLLFAVAAAAAWHLGRRLARLHAKTGEMLRASMLRTEHLLTERLFIGDRGVKLPELPPWFWDDAAILARHDVERGEEVRH